MSSLEQQLSPAALRELLRYEPDTGRLFWLPRPRCYSSSNRQHNAWNAKWAGREALTATSKKGYRYGTVLTHGARAHRVAYAIFHGEWPDQVDHIDGDPANNRSNNLRSVTAKVNQRNMKRQERSTSGVTGVYRCKDTNRWRARIVVDRVQIHLGRFDSIEAAASARKAAEAKHEFHPNHGRSV